MGRRDWATRRHESSENTNTGSTFNDLQTLGRRIHQATVDKQGTTKPRPFALPVLGHPLSSTELDWTLSIGGKVVEQVTFGATGHHRCERVGGQEILAPAEEAQVDVAVVLLEWTPVGEVEEPLLENIVGPSERAHDWISPELLEPPAHQTVTAFVQVVEISEQHLRALVAWTAAHRFQRLGRSL